MLKRVFELNGSAEAVEVELERTDDEHREAYFYRREDVHLEVEIDVTGSGSGFLRHHGLVLPYHAIREGDRIDVWLAGKSYVLRQLDRTAQRAAAEGVGVAIGDITAAMPGTILEILIGEGDAFAAHQPLVIMESMKMEMTLSSPQAGRIKAIDCRVGDLVEMGALLVKLEAVDAGADDA